MKRLGEVRNLWDTVVGPHWAFGGIKEDPVIADSLVEPALLDADERRGASEFENMAIGVFCVCGCALSKRTVSIPLKRGIRTSIKMTLGIVRMARVAELVEYIDVIGCGFNIHVVVFGQAGKCEFQLSLIDFNDERRIFHLWLL